MKNAYFKHIFSLLLFGANGVVASNINLSSYEIVLWRTLLGSVFLVAFFFLTSQKLTFYKHKKDTMFIAISGISMGTSWMFLYEGFAQIGVSLASLLYYTGPVIVMALSPIMFGEKLTRYKVFGFMAVFIGVFLINGNIFSDSFNLWGFACGLLSALTYSFMVMFNKKSTNVVGLENSMLQLIVSFITVSIFVGFKTGGTLTLANVNWAWVLLLGLLTTGFGCYLFFSTISKLPVQTVAILGYLEPLSALIFASIFLKETLTLWQIIGAVLIIGGAIFAQLYKKRTV